MLRLLTAAFGTFETSTDVSYSAAFVGNADISGRLKSAMSGREQTQQQMQLLDHLVGDGQHA